MKQDDPNKLSDHLANERTFLAWVRTSVGIMAFGFVVVKFTLFMREISLMLGKQPQPTSKGYSSLLGIALVSLGIFTTLFAFLRYKRIEKQLNADFYKPSPILITALCILILLVSSLLIIYLLRSL